MDIVTLKAPEGQELIPYGKKFIVVEDDGTVLVPLIAAADLVALGCTSDKPIAEQTLDDCDEMALRWVIDMHQKPRRPLVDPSLLQTASAKDLRDIAVLVAPALVASKVSVKAKP